MSSKFGCGSRRKFQKLFFSRAMQLDLCAHDFLALSSNTKQPYEEMADPLSIAASCVGILTAAAHISSLLIKFTSTAKHAPEQSQAAQAVLTEVGDISGILSQLQSFQLRANSIVSSKNALLQVDQVVSIISGRVLTFLGLPELLNGLKGEYLIIIEHTRWALRK